MYHRADVIYRYDGTWEGLLSCVFESFEKKVFPLDIRPWYEEQGMLLPERMIDTDEERARRVKASLRSRISVELYEFLTKCFLTCLPQKEIHILMLIRKAYSLGPGILDQLTDDTVDILTKAVYHAEHEAHMLTGFVRFSVMGNILVSQIGPKNQVLPLIAPHFAQRFPREAFLIHDSTHGMALVYRPYEWAIVPMEGFEMASPDTQEAYYRALWQEFYDAIAIPARYNPRCRMSHMPKRYWKFMTEFQEKEPSVRAFRG